GFGLDRRATGGPCPSPHAVSPSSGGGTIPRLYSPPRRARDRSPAWHRRARRARAAARQLWRLASARARALLARHHGEHLCRPRGGPGDMAGDGSSLQSPSASAAGPPWRAGAPAAGRGEPVWPCVASRTCGFKATFSSRATCWQCGRDRQGRFPIGGGLQRAPRTRSASAARRHRGHAAPPRAAGASGADGASAKSDESEALVRARKALAALRRLQYDDDHPSIVNLTREVRALEADERRRRPPDAVLRSGQDRLAAKTKEKEDKDKQLVAAKAQVVDLRKRSESLSVEVGALQQEVAEARALATVSAAGHNGLDLAAMASNMLNLQTLIGNAQQSVGAGPRRAPQGRRRVRLGAKRRPCRARVGASD
ncbi:unnamed protein product, partial [Prorocentrum cordatum]